MAERATCDICDGPLPPQGFYVVRVEVFADPSLPAVSAEEVAGIDFDEEMETLLKQMEKLSAEELQDQVHRRFEFRVCGRCQGKILANPLGLPRMDEREAQRSGVRRN
jgi:hypothetical protein